MKLGPSWREGLAMMTVGGEELDPPDTFGDMSFPVFKSEFDRCFFAVFRDRHSRYEYKQNAEQDGPGE